MSIRSWRATLLTFLGEGHPGTRESGSGRSRRPVASVTIAHSVPPALALAVAAVWLGVASGWGASSVPPASSGLAGAVMLAGVLVGALAGRVAAAADRRAIVAEGERTLDDLDHDLRTPMTIIRGEVELVLSQDDITAEERGRSSATVIGEVERMEQLIRRRYR